MTKPVRILLVDDSEVFVDVMVKAIASSRQAELAGIARNGREGVEMASRLRPDVVSMDVHMPEMDGLEAVEHIMAQTPTPIAMVTAAESHEMAHISFRAIGGGALDVISKPSGPREAQAIVRRLCVLSKVRAVQRPRRTERSERPEQRAAAAETGARSGHGARLWKPDQPLRPVEVVAIAVSTGGPPVLERILQALPPDFAAGVLVVQHLSPGFGTHLVEWLRGSTKADVGLATSVARVAPGRVWIARAGAHLCVRMGGGSRSTPRGTASRVTDRRGRCSSSPWPASTAPGPPASFSRAWARTAPRAYGRSATPAASRPPRTAPRAPSTGCPALRGRAGRRSGSCACTTCPRS